jgi:hypothetical protein
MTDYLAIARECGAHVLDRYDQVHFSNAALSAFAERVRQDERERIGDTLSSALQSDLENGVKWLSELASATFAGDYPALHKAIAAMTQQVPERAE